MFSGLNLIVRSKPVLPAVMKVGRPLDHSPLLAGAGAGLHSQSLGGCLLPGWGVGGGRADGAWLLSVDAYPWMPKADGWLQKVKKNCSMHLL